MSQQYDWKTVDSPPVTVSGDAPYANLFDLAAAKQDALKANVIAHLNRELFSDGLHAVAPPLTRMSKRNQKRRKGHRPRRKGKKRM